MLRFNSHWKIIFTVTLANVLGELAIRSFANVASIGAIFFLYLFLTYFTFAIVCEYHIVQKKLNDVGLYIIALALVIWWQILFPLAIFAPPRLLGINWGLFLFVDILMWSPIQGVLFFYLARRLFVRKQNEPFVSKKIYFLSLTIFSLLTLSLHAIFGFLGLINVLGYFVLIILLVGTIKLYNKFLQSPASYVQNAHNSSFLDVLSVIVLFILFICAFFIPLDSQSINNNVHIFNRNSYIVCLATSALASIILFLYRLTTKKQIPV